MLARKARKSVRLGRESTAECLILPGKYGIQDARLVQIRLSPSRACLSWCTPQDQEQARYDAEDVQGVQQVEAVVLRIRSLEDYLRSQISWSL